MSIIKEFVYRLRGEFTTEKLVKMGLTVGRNFHRLNGVILDSSHCWLITIGDNVTLAPRVHILCHDASTKHALNYTKIGRVDIGNHVFIGASTVVLPNVRIGDYVIIGANSTVTKDIPSNSVAVGSPAKVIMTYDEYINKERERMKSAHVYEEEFTLNGSITAENKLRQKEELKDGIGYIK